MERSILSGDRKRLYNDPRDAERERWIKLHDDLSEEDVANAKCKRCSDTGVIIAFSVFGTGMMAFARCSCPAAKDVLH